jgi:hypothetical protein
MFVVLILVISLLAFEAVLLFMLLLLDMRRSLIRFRFRVLLRNTKEYCKNR